MASTSAQSRAAFEFGCGSARLIRHIRPLTGIRIVGSDLSAASTAWCQENLPGIEFYQNGLEPPLTFAEDNAFDLAIASSVFTHIPLDTQAAWLEEVARVIRPGGYFMCTVQGDAKQRQMLTAKQLEELEASGELVLDATAANVSVSTRVTGTWETFQSRRKGLEAFSQHFEILDYLPGNQDLMVCRSPATGAVAPHWPPTATRSTLDEARANWK